MNVSRSIFFRERGFGFTSKSDIALLHLKCHHEDVYTGVVIDPTNQAREYYPSIYACKFSSTPGYEHILSLGNADGQLALPNTAAEKQFIGPGMQAHNDSIYDIAWMPKELKLISASRNGSSTLWDVSGSSINYVQTFINDTQPVRTIAFRPQDKSVFATGNRDGKIMIWDTRANRSGESKPDNVIFNAHIKKTKKPSTVTALAFQSDENLISCSAGDGLIKVWDLRKYYSIFKQKNCAKHTMKYGGNNALHKGFTSMMINQTNTTLYASSVDKTIYAYNLNLCSTNPVAEYYRHSSNDQRLSFFVKASLSSDGEYIVSGSNHKKVYVWSTRRPGLPFLKLSGNRNEVTCIDWSRNKTEMVTCTRNVYEIWRIRPDAGCKDEQINITGYAELYDTSSTLPYCKKSSLKTPKSTCLPSNKRNRVSLDAISESFGSTPNRTNNDDQFSRNLFSSKDFCPETAIPSQHSSFESSFLNHQILLNFVDDGTAPPKKKTKANNWLQELRKRKMLENIDKNLPPNPKKKRKTQSSKVESQRVLRFD